MANHGKFGRRGPYPEWAAPRLKVHDFVDFAALPEPSATIDYVSKVPAWPMYLNDQIGDCTAATVGHEIEAWTRYAQASEVTIGNQDVLKLYEATGGYVPGDPNTDNGAVIQDVLDYWHKNGVAGHKIVAFAKLEGYSRKELRQCLELFGTVYLGIQCPQSALDQFNAGEPWTYQPGSPIAGGHAIPLQAWDTTRYNPAVVVTWGQAQRVGPRFLDHYVEEAWVIITEDWLNAQGVAPSGVNLQQLAEDYTLLTGKPNPMLPASGIVVRPAPVKNPVPDRPGFLRALWYRIRLHLYGITAA